jgi:phage major head subunit gpT-like protein
MSAPVILKGNHSQLFGPNMLPALEELFRAELELHPSRRDALFTMKKITSDLYQASSLEGLPLFSQMSEGEDYSYQSVRQGASKNIQPVKFGLGFSISEEAIEDGKIDMIAHGVQAMARSARESQEIQAMRIFNEGFSSTVTTPDGANLFSTTHSNPSGLTFRNKASSDLDLSQSALEAAYNDMETQFIDDNGLIQYCRPKILLVPSILRRTAEEIVKTPKKLDSEYNNINTLSDDGLIVISSPHLTDADAWFLLADKRDTGLRIISRKGIETKSNDVFDNDSVRYKSRYREKVDVVHARGVWGSTGNG